MATYNSPGYTKKSGSNAHGWSRSSCRMHEVIALPATLALNDVINVGYLPAYAIVTGCNLKAQGQLDSNGAPALTFDVGVTGTPQLFKAAVSTVGRAAGASNDTTLSAAGSLYQNAAGSDLLVFITVHAAAATAVAGNLEVEVTYFVEEPGGRPA